MKANNVPKKYVYRLRTFINASHAVRWEQGQGAQHPHTWELILDIEALGTPASLKFEDIEQVIDATVEQFSGHFINEVPPFDKENPTLENFADYLFDILTTALQEINCKLLNLSVGESPLRFYNVALAE